MKLGIIGLPGSGKLTLFEAFTGNTIHRSQKRENHIGTVTVPDQRIDHLKRMYRPRKTTYAQIEYFLPGLADCGTDQKKENISWSQVRDCDALIHVVRNFRGYGLPPPTPKDAFHQIDQDLIISDLVVVEKRLERLILDRKRGKKGNFEESELLASCQKHLNAEIPLRKFPELAFAPLLRGFAFLSAKPMLVLFNNEDEDDLLPDIPDILAKEDHMVIRGKLEQELVQMSPGEVEDFLTEFNITASAMDRIIKRSYKLLGLISFFTVGEDEVRAWTIKKGTTAIDAAEVIHSDIKKGFIRAEVLAYEDLTAAGTYVKARKKGTVRLEGKTYFIKDGDIINFRFNV
jgi:GTP-binding protein YchF